MAILKNVEIHYAKVDPARPNARFNKENPAWEVQLRTTERAVSKEWEELGLKPKAVLPEEEGAKPYWRVNLRKKTIKADGSKSGPVQVVDARRRDIDPNSIGHGSIANVRIHQYEYENAGVKGLASVLMGIQVIKLILYVPSARDDDFEDMETETETVMPPEGVIEDKNDADY